MSLVSLVKINNDFMGAAIRDSLRLINYGFPKKIQRIVIKPNMCYYWDSSTGQTTDPKFVGALIDVIRKDLRSDVDISLVESDASAMKCRHAFRFLGYQELAKEYDVKLINLSEDKSDPIDVVFGNRSYRFMVPQTIQDADLKINVTKIKYSLDEIKLTCALKNIFGCNPYPKKFRYHPKLGEIIVLLNKIMKFDLCLVDGNIVYGATTRRLGLAMASEDPVALDAAAAQISGLNPSNIGYLRLACKEGLGQIDFAAKGVPIDYFKDRYPRKDGRKKLMSKAYKVVSLLKLGKKLGLE